MKTHIYDEVFPGVARSAVWALWSDVEGWARWDEDIEYAKIAGPFREGTRIVLKPKDGPQVSLELTHVAEMQGFTDVARFPLARMHDRHMLEDTPDGLRIKIRIWVEGPLAWLWEWLVARGVAAGVPKQTQALVRLAQVGRS